VVRAAAVAFVAGDGCAVCCQYSPSSTSTRRSTAITTTTTERA
jgi:hypothetical protein